eukprot:10791628-Alexandrium_andersonii.AAC.1
MPRLSFRQDSGQATSARCGCAPAPWGLPAQVPGRVRTQPSSRLPPAPAAIRTTSSPSGFAGVPRSGPACVSLPFPLFSLLQGPCPGHRGIAEEAPGFPARSLDLAGLPRTTCRFAWVSSAT